MKVIKTIKLSSYNQMTLPFIPPLEGDGLGGVFHQAK